MIDTLLLNKADYEQPFPDVQLVFKTRTTAWSPGRRFSPSQYLQGGWQGKSGHARTSALHILKSRPRCRGRQITPLLYWQINRPKQKQQILLYSNGACG